MGSAAEVTGLRDSRNSEFGGRSDEGTAEIVSSAVEVTGLRDSRNSGLAAEVTGLSDSRNSGLGGRSDGAQGQQE